MIKLLINTRYQKFVLPAILLITIVVLINTILNGFTNWDDDIYILNNNFIRDFSWSGVNKIMFSYTGLGGTRLTLLNFLLDYHLWKINPLPYHLINLIFHLFNVALIFVLIKKLFNKTEVAAITALLFAIHPMHVESVAWIAERKDVLYTFFLLLSLHCYHSYIQNTKKIIYLLLTFLFFFLSWHSKLSAATLPAILILFDYYYSRRISFKLILEKVPFFLFVIFYTFNIFSSHSATGGDFHHLTANFSFLDRILMAGYSLGFYLLKFIAPFKLYAVHPYPVKAGGTLPAVYYMATIAVFVISAILVWIVYKLKNQRKEIVFGLLFFLFTISMFIHFIPIKGVIVVADRYTYVPYIGLFFIVGFLFDRIYNNEKYSASVKKISSWLLTAFFILFAVLSWNRTLVWKDSMTLFTDVINKNPKIEAAYNNRGNAKREMGDYKGAIKDYSESIRLNPSFPLSYNNRGITRVNLKEYTKAIEDMNMAIALKTDYEEAYYNRAITKKAMKEYDDLLSDLNSAIKYKKDFASAYLERGIEKYRRKEFEDALADLNYAIKLKSNNAEVYYYRGNIKKDRQDHEGAIRDYSMAIKINPKYPEAYNNRGYSKNSTGDYKNALADFDKALELRKDFPEAHNNKGIALANLQRVQESLDEFTAAIKLKPAYTEALNNRGNAKAFLKDYKGSIEDFNLLLQQKPNDSLAYVNRGNSKYKLNDLQGACRDWGIAFEKGFKPAGDLIKNYCK